MFVAHGQALAGRGGSVTGVVLSCTANESPVITSMSLSRAVPELLESRDISPGSGLATFVSDSDPSGAATPYMTYPRFVVPLPGMLTLILPLPSTRTASGDLPGPVGRIARQLDQHGAGSKAGLDAVTGLYNVVIAAVEPHDDRILTLVDVNVGKAARVKGVI